MAEELEKQPYKLYAKSKNKSTPLIEDRLLDRLTYRTFDSIIAKVDRDEFSYDQMF